MIVITLSDCPPKLRGDLSMWMIEINTGVYVGNMSTRVRDEIWQRICENLKNGKATMVFNTSGEQHMDFRVHNTSWEPVDFDGLKLMRRPSPSRMAETTVHTGQKRFSDAANQQIARQINTARRRTAASDDYVVIDVETTGLSAAEDCIIEMAALRVSAGEPVDHYVSLIKQDMPIPGSITQLTGITAEQIASEGRPIAKALDGFLNFIGTSRIVSHNAVFDIAFIRAACRQCGVKQLINPCTDTLSLARRKIDGVENHKLSTLAAYYSLDTTNAHRALGDCYLTHQLYIKLNEI